MIVDAVISTGFTLNLLHFWQYQPTHRGPCRESSLGLPFTRTHYKTDLYSRNEMQSITEPRDLSPQRFTLALYLSRRFLLFLLTRKLPGPRLELGGTISTIHAFRRGPSFFLSLAPNSALVPRFDEFYSDFKAKPGFRRAIQMTRKGRTEAEAMEHAVARAGHVATRFHGRHTTLSRSLALRRTFNEPAGERNTRGCVPLPRNDICSVELRGTRATVCIMSDRDVL